MEQKSGTEQPLAGFISIPVLLVLFLGAIYVYSMYQPQKIDMPTQTSVAGSQDLGLYTVAVLDDVEKMPPMVTLRQAIADKQPLDDAVGEARHLIEQDKWNVRNLMCVGDVFTSIPDNADLNKEGYGCLRLATQLCPNSKYVRLNYARALARGKRYEESTVEYEKIVKIAHDIIPSLELSRLYLDNGDEDKAITVLKAVLEKDNGNVPARKLLGISLARNHDEQGGFEEYLKAFAQEQMVGYPETARALVVANKDSLPEAITAQREILKNQPTEQNALLLSEMLLFDGKTAEAKSLCEEWKQKEASDPEVHRVLAEIYHQKDNSEQAYQEWLLANKLEKESS